MSIDWAGMTADENEENRVWCENFIENNKKPKQDSDELLVDWSDMSMECHGGCGVKRATNVCGRCKEICKSSPSSV